jgi:hypothetical protein
LNLFVCHSSGFSSVFPFSLLLCLPQLSPEQVSSEILRSLIKVTLIPSGHGSMNLCVPRLYSPLL